MFNFNNGEPMLSTPQEILNKLNERGIEVRPISVTHEVVGMNVKREVIKEDLNDIHYIKKTNWIFIINKHTSKEFFDIVFENNDDIYLDKIIQILNVYAYFDYMMYTVNQKGFTIGGKFLDVTYQQKENITEQTDQKSARFTHSNLCQEISIGPIMKCVLGTQNTEYTYEDLYNKILYPQFKEMIKAATGLELLDMSQFNDRIFELLKMVKI